MLRPFAKRIAMHLFPQLIDRNLPRYPFLVHPAGLAFLCQCIDKTATLKGPIVEIGCAAGHTTIVLNKHMDWLGIEKPYICIDTFRGFPPEHVKFEVEFRSKEGTYRGAPSARKNQ